LLCKDIINKYKGAAYRTFTLTTLFAGTDKKSLIPRPMLLAKPRGLPMTPAEPNNFKFRKK